MLNINSVTVLAIRAGVSSATLYNGYLVFTLFLPKVTFDLYTLYMIFLVCTWYLLNKVVVLHWCFSLMEPNTSCKINFIRSQRTFKCNWQELQFCLSLDWDHLWSLRSKQDVCTDYLTYGRPTVVGIALFLTHFLNCKY